MDKSGPVDGAALNATARVLSGLCAALQMHLPSPGTHVAIRVIDERLQRTLQPLRFQTRHATRYTVFCDIFGGKSEGNNVPVHEPIQPAKFLAAPRPDTSRSVGQLTAIRVPDAAVAPLFPGSWANLHN